MAALILTIKLMFTVWAGIGTVFYAQDEFNPDPHLACSPHTILNDKDLVIAHRTLPCDTKVTVCNPRTNLCANANVKDRGPYGKINGNYTAIVDMSAGVARKIKHNGFEPVLLISPLKILEPKSKRRRYVRNNS